MIRIALNIDSAESIAAAAVKCAEVLRQPGAVLLIPTETVYGLVCRYDDLPAIDRIYQLKRRSETKPLAWFVSSVGRLSDRGVQLPATAVCLAAEFCPGPLTMIVAGSDGNTIGFRIPDHPLILGLFRLIDFPLASTSANRSGCPNATSVDAALAEFDGSPELVVDGGSLPEGALASTVVDLSRGGWRILREGAAGADAVEATLMRSGLV